MAIYNVDIPSTGAPTPQNSETVADLNYSTPQFIVGDERIEERFGVSTLSVQISQSAANKPWTIRGLFQCY